MSSTSASMSESPPRNDSKRCGRKRLRFEEEWKRRQKKLKKDSGKAYTTYKGDQRAEKELVDIECKCVYNCRSKVNDTERERIFHEFYKLKSHDVQNKYLFGLICKQPVKRKRVTAASRTHSIVYRVRLRNGSHVQVCKKTFCDLHAITKRRIEILRRSSQLACYLLLMGEGSTPIVPMLSRVRLKTPSENI